MPIEVERLVATLEARIDKYEKNLAKAAGTTDRQFKRIEDRGKRLQTQLGSIGKNAFAGLIRGAALGLAPILSVAAAVNTAKQALKEFGDIADDAKASGLDSELFQGIAYQANLGGVAYEKLAGSLAFYNKNAGLAAAQKGKLYSQLTILNPELLKNIQLAQTQEERVKLAADAISRESDASRRAALSTALFGEAGGKLADVFKDGAAGIDSWLAKAKQLGIVVDRDLIARADKLGDEFDTATKVLDLQFKQILVELAPWLTATAQGIAEIIRQLRGLGTAVPDVGSPTRQLEKDIADYQTMLSGDKWLWDRYAVTQKLSEAMAELARRQKAAKSPESLTVAPSTFDFRSFLNNRASNTGSTGFIDPGAPARAEDAVREAEAIKDLIEQLQFEKDLIGKSALEQRKMNALRDAGSAATSTQREQIALLTEQIYSEQNRLDLMQSTWEKLGDVGVSAMQRLTDAMEDGQIEGKELLDILLDVLSQATQFLGSAAPGNTGQTMLQSLFSLIGGGGGATGGTMGKGRWGSAIFGTRAGGGSARPGQPIVVGERRPELFVPESAGRIVPSLPGGGGIKVNVQNYGARVRTQQRQGPSGPELDVMVDLLAAKQISRPGSRMFKALRTSHSTSQPLTDR